MPDSRIRSRISSRTQTNARVIPWLCNPLIECSSASQALVSMKFTALPPQARASLVKRLAASAVFSPSSTFDTRKEQLTTRASNQQLVRFDGAALARTIAPLKDDAGLQAFVHHPL